MNKLVSVAMATYNGAQYLKEQLDSIYSQTYKNFEVIVVDDISTDKTIQVLEQYKQKYGLTYFVNDENLGVTKNFEKAISLCKGEYIALVDQDDIWLPEKIEVLYENIGAASLIYSNAGIINSKGKIQNITTKEMYPLYGLDSSTEDIYNYIVLNSFILGCSTMFKRELLTDLIPIYESNRNHDWWLTVCAYNRNGIKYIDEVLFYYRHHENNYSRQGKQTSNLVKILNFYSNEKMLKRKTLVIEQYEIINLFKKFSSYTKKEISFLNEIELFCKSYLNTKIHFKAFLIALKYKKYMFLMKSNMLKKLNILNTLIGW